MGLYVSIPIFPGMRIGGRLGRGRPVRKKRGVAPVALLLILCGMAGAPVVAIAAAIVLGMAALWLVFICARYALLTVLHQPALTPRDALRRTRLRLGALYLRVRDPYLRVRDAYRRNRARR